MQVKSIDPTELKVTRHPAPFFKRILALFRTKYSYSITMETTVYIYRFIVVGGELRVHDAISLEVELDFDDFKDRQAGNA